MIYCWNKINVEEKVLCVLNYLFYRLGKCWDVVGHAKIGGDGFWKLLKLQI